MSQAVRDFYRALGRRIQQHRKRRRLTQEQLGARLNPQVTRASIANIESGKQRVLAHSLAQIAEAFDMPADELIGGKSGRIESGVKQQVEAQLQDRLKGKAISPEDLQRLSRKLGLDEETTGDETDPDAVR